MFRYFCWWSEKKISKVYVEKKIVIFHFSVFFQAKVCYHNVFSTSTFEGMFFRPFKTPKCWLRKPLGLKKKVKKWKITNFFWRQLLNFFFGPPKKYIAKHLNKILWWSRAKCPKKQFLKILAKLTLNSLKKVKKCLGGGGYNKKVPIFANIMV
jgi:hypothetical protein